MEVALRVKSSARDALAAPQCAQKLSSKPHGERRRNAPDAMIVYDAHCDE
jgi:hypothetical protein